ncbi:MAG: hypothetical protein ACP5QO_03570 [Clostridia bacterium]
MAKHLDDLTREILALPHQEQRELLRRLRLRLHIPDEEWGWLKANESAFAFWDNPEDGVYHRG